MTLSLRLLSTSEGDRKLFKEFEIFDDGKFIGTTDLAYFKEERFIKIGSLSLRDEAGLEIDTSFAANALGPAKIRELLRLVKAEFPQAISIGGIRVSGMRSAAALKRAREGSQLSPEQEFPFAEVDI